MKYCIATTVLALAVSATGHAEHHTVEGGYVGGTFGATNYDDGKAHKDAGAELDDSDTGYQIYGGYRFLKYFALEGRLSNLGEYKLGNGRDLINTEFAALTGNAVGILPFGESGVELYGHLGAGMLSRQTDASFPVPEDNDNSAVGTAGLGLRFTPGSFNAITVSAGYDTYLFQAQDYYTDSNHDQSVSMAKLGLQYNF